MMQAPDFIPNVDIIWGQDQDGVADEGYNPDHFAPVSALEGGKGHLEQ